MTVVLTNNASSTVAGAVAATDITLTVATGEGTLFPILTGAQYFYATLVSSAGAYEIVKVTGRTGDAMSITRAQEGTVAQAFVVDSRFEARITAASINDTAADLSTALAAAGGGALVGFTPAGTIVATDVQAAIEELDSELATSLTTGAVLANDSSLGITGLAAAQGGAVALVGGTSSSSANPGGAVTSTGGTPGATGVGGAARITGGPGGATSGTGGVAAVVGGASGTGATGNGGNATITGGAAASTNGNGGSVVFTPGVLAGSGYTGLIIDRGKKLVAQGVPTAKTTSATLTAAEILAGIITVNQGAAGASAQQLPTATAMDTGFPAAAIGDAFDLYVINTSTVGAEDATLTTNTGWTLVGNMEIQSADVLTNNTSGHFRLRKSGAAAWTIYRLS